MTKDEFHNWLWEYAKRRIAAVDGDEKRLDINQRIEDEAGSNGGSNFVLQIESPSGARGDSPDGGIGRRRILLALPERGATSS